MDGSADELPRDEVVLDEAAPPDGPPFSALVTHEAGQAIVDARGDMDLCTAPAFRRAVVSLLSHSVDSVAIDMQDLSFIDSSGLHALNAIRIEADLHDVRLTLQKVPRHALRTLEICGMAELFELAPLVSVPTEG